MNSVKEPLFCCLTTFGRRSGRPHTVQIGLATNDGMVYMLGARDGASDWIKNLRVNRDAWLFLGYEEYDAVARPIDADSDDARLARKLFCSKYTEEVWHRNLEEWTCAAMPILLQLTTPLPSQRTGPYAEDQIITHSDPERLAVFERSRDRSRQRWAATTKEEGS